MAAEQPHTGEQPEREQTKSPRRFWLVEMWEENRALFKELIKHILIFSLFIALLSGSHYLLQRSKLPQDELELVSKVHFYTYVVALVIFSASFIIKVVIYEFRGTRT